MTAFAVVGLVLTIISLDINRAWSSEQEPAPVVNNFMSISYYDDCDNSDQGEFTGVTTYTTTCDLSTALPLSPHLIQTQPDGTIAVNSLTSLASSTYPNGAYRNRESLYLITSGPLQGKYIYFKTMFSDYEYLKKCSSVLGYPYITSKSALLLIIDKIDVKTLYSLSSGYGYDAVNKLATTRCYGSLNIV